jgi:hypothetical protein
MDYIKCSSNESGAFVTREQYGRKFIIRNESHKTICVIDVDGCLLDDSTEKCDYAFEIDDPFTSVIYVELKGSDISKALSQLTSTLRHCGARHGKSKRVCYIVASRVPKAGPKVQVMKANMVKLYGVQLFVHTTQAEFKP